MPIIHPRGRDIPSGEHALDTGHPQVVVDPDAAKPRLTTLRRIAAIGCGSSDQAANDAVAEVAVVGVPDDRWGERVHAVAVPPRSGPR